ncbi:MAG: phosphatase PAP2 family protein [Jatrophihabitans sp.]|uniref:phosphatase PAP2 family protein n=1 Tax=Jatrophihabitans sp. TaxID=1932789 RepID=UPI00391233AF
MNSLIAWLANYLLWIMAAVALVHGLVRERGSARVTAAASAVVGLGLTLLFILIAAKLHTDPRPFVQNPHLHPLISHSADNGFPSDHSAAAGLIAMLVTLRDRLVGAFLWLIAIGVGAARMAAHVHHLQDVAAGLALGAVAAVLATALVQAAASRIPALR